MFVDVCWAFRKVAFEIVRNSKRSNCLCLLWGQLEVPQSQLWHLPGPIHDRDKMERCEMALNCKIRYWSYRTLRQHCWPAEPQDSSMTESVVHRPAVVYSTNKKRGDLHNHMSINMYPTSSCKIKWNIHTFLHFWKTRWEKVLVFQSHAKLKVSRLIR